MIPGIHYTGADWSRFEEWLQEEQLDTYKRLASTEATASETEQLRGRAQFIARLLDLKNIAADFSRPL